MRRLSALVIACAGATLPPAAAFAQNAAQVSRVRAGSGCPGCNLFQADLANRELRAIDLSGARLRQADMSAAVLAHARLRRSDLRDLNGYGVVMTGADLREADLTNASLVGAYLEGADLTGARIDGVNFSGAEMTRTRGLSPHALAHACGDASTRLPRGLALSACR